MRPMVVFPDAQAAAIRILRAGLDLYQAVVGGDVTVGSRVPDDRSVETPHLPHVMVRLDSDQTRWPVDARVLLRVTVWHHTPEDALDLAQLCRGLLHTIGHGYGIRAIESRSIGPVVGLDPDSHTDLATFTVVAHVRPTPVDVL